MKLEKSERDFDCQARHLSMACCCLLTLCCFSSLGTDIVSQSTNSWEILSSFLLLTALSL